MALRPLPQTLLMVRAETLEGRPPRRAAWRAGAWPTPALTTLPKIASVGTAPGTAASRAFTTWAARSGAARGASAPWNFPMGLRRDLRMTAVEGRETDMANPQQRERRQAVAVSRIAAGDTERMTTWDMGTPGIRMMGQRS